MIQASDFVASRFGVEGSECGEVSILGTSRQEYTPSRSEHAYTGPYHGT